MTPELRVRFTKRADGAVVLQCVRKDGSATWQRHDKQAVFFSFHDLSHFAVETILGFSRGFYGLLADGWDIRDTTGKGTRGRLPPEAIFVEHVVGLLERERAGGAMQLSAVEFNAQMEQLLATDHLQAGRTFSDPELAAVRQRIEMLHGEWAVIPPGSTLELSFDRGGEAK